jgi:2-succinyl-5-enolpyruvyl-6-hydroxy-3-cyclohexene-1-carboxylate synthase
MQPPAFFTQLAARLPVAGRESGDGGYQAAWRSLDEQAAAVLARLGDPGPLSEFAAVWHVLGQLPPGSLLQAGNSMPIRYVNLLGFQPGHHPAQVNANRGTSGIDGTVSTAVGAALATQAMTTLIVGDLGFFYDRNGLWHRHLPDNLRIVVLNNHGGGIFDIIEGPNRLERGEQETYFLTPQPLTARRTAEDHGLRYLHAANTADLLRHLPGFFAAGGGPALLEIETVMAANTAAYAEVKAALAGVRV